MTSGTADEPVGARIARLRATVEARVASSQSFEESAAAFADEFYAAFSEFTILTRVFAIVPCRRLDAREREFLGTLDEGTPVLTLFGTRGIEAAWNDRSASRDHRAIPLVSRAFVEDAPMIAKLLNEIGGRGFIESDGDWQFVSRVGEGDGVFFVGDARTATDDRGRAVIPAVDFVDRYGVRTVFGFGRHSDDGSLVVVIVFARKSLLRSFAASFVTLIDVLRYGSSGIGGPQLFSKR